jgi:hypothetical protein
MKRAFSFGAMTLTAAWMLAGCYSNNRVGNDALSIGSKGGDMAGATYLATGIEVEIDGMTAPVGCSNGRAGVAFQMGATCGSAAIGDGPIFQTANCTGIGDSPPPSYMIGALFRNYDQSTGIPDGTTYDLSDPGHEHFITVMLGYQPVAMEPEYDYCTAPPTDLPDGGTYPASSGTVTVNHFATSNTPNPAMPTFNADVELTNVVVPSYDGGPAMKVVAAHLVY